LNDSFDINEKSEKFFDYVYNKRKTLLKPSDESFFNLLEGQIRTTGKILHFNMYYAKYVLILIRILYIIHN